MIVSNSSPLIVLGKVGAFQLLQECFGTVLVPAAVYKEVQNKGGTPEAVALDRGIQEKWLVIEKVMIDRQLKTEKIGQGEKEAICLAARKKCPVLLDDDLAKGFAAVLGVEARGTLFVLLVASAQKFISRSEAIEILDRMILNGFYLSTEVYARFLSLLGRYRIGH